MRLSMMPTTKKKLGSIGLFMRQGDGTVRSGGPATGSTSNPRAVGLPVTPAPASIPATGHHTQLPQLQPPPEIIAARQERQQADKAADNNNNNQKAPDKAADNHRQADKQPDTPAPAPAPATATATAAARSIPVPRGRHAAATHPTATMSLPVQHYHPMQRTRTSASDTAREAQRERGGHNAWEDSTVASMFGDNESRAPASERLRVPQGGHSRHYSDAPPQRALPLPPTRTQPKHEENLPFVIGENGILKVLPPSSTQKATDTAPATTNAVLGGIFDDQSVKQDDVYHEARQLYETPTKASGLRRTKLAYRDNRDARSNASSDREASGYSPTSQSVSLSPERQPQPAGHIDRIRLQERLARDRERQRERDLEREREREREREKKRQMEQERELQHKRSTLFENLTPLEFETIDFNDTKAAVVAPSTGLDADALKEALQRTPRANRLQPHLQPHLQPQPLFASQNITANTNNALKEAPPPFGRTGSRRLKSPSKQDPAATTTTTTTSRKRRQSLDYNDAELHAMSYASLREQAFDFDPQTAAALQPPPPAATTAVPPTGGSLEDRLEHYRRQGSMDQHEFFTRVTVDEWDEAGDWFLTQFGDVVQRLKRARRAKRQLVARFEDEVAAREEAVRGKMEGIERTLEELKEEGQTMMEGKDVEVEF